MLYMYNPLCSSCTKICSGSVYSPRRKDQMTCWTFLHRQLSVQYRPHIRSCVPTFVCLSVGTTNFYLDPNVASTYIKTLVWWLGANASDAGLTLARNAHFVYHWSALHKTNTDSRFNPWYWAARCCRGLDPSQRVAAACYATPSSILLTYRSVRHEVELWHAYKVSHDDFRHVPDHIIVQ